MEYSSGQKWLILHSGNQIWIRDGIPSQPGHSTVVARLLASKPDWANVAVHPPINNGQEIPLEISISPNPFSHRPPPYWDIFPIHDDEYWAMFVIVTSEKETDPSLLRR